MSNTEILITRDKLQSDLEDLYNYKIKPYLNGEGRTVIIKSGTVTKNSPYYTFTDIPTSYQYTINFFADKQINYSSINTSIPTQITITYNPNDFDDENEIVNVYCRMELVVINGAAITDFKITNLPRKLKYNTGYKLNLNKVVATAYFSDEISSNVTTGTEFNPPDGTVLNTTGKNIITASFHNFIDKFEVEVQNRKLVTALPYDFYQGCAVVYNNEIHILGGNGGIRNHYRFNGTNWVWTSTLPYGFRYGCAVVYNNEIHIMGGTDYNNETNYNKHYKWNGKQWIYIRDLPYGIYNGCAVVYNNEIHIMGTSSNSSWYRYHYKFNGSSWSLASTLPYDFYNGCAVVYNNEIHILGSSNGNYYTSHYKWNGSNWSWASTLPYHTHYGGVVYYNVGNDNEIHILGGSNNTTAHYKWNGTSWIWVSTLPYNFYDYPHGNAVMWNSGCEEDIVILGSESGRRRIGQYDEVSGWRSV